MNLFHAVVSKLVPPIHCQLLILKWKKEITEYNRNSIVVVRPTDDHREIQTPNLFLFSVLLSWMNITG